MTPRIPKAALRRGLLVTACALALPASATAAAGDWTSYDIPGDGSHGRSLAASPTGEIFFTAEGPDVVGRITPDGQLSTHALSGLPGAAAVTADGTTWVAQRFTGKLTRLDPGSETPVDVPGVLGAETDPMASATTGDGSVWFTDLRGGQLVHATGAGATISDAIAGGAQPFGLAEGSDGNLWVAEIGLGRISRITSAGAVTRFQLAPDLRPSDITAGPDGALWFVTYTGRMGRITTDGEVSWPWGYDDRLLGVATSITFGPDGAFWVTGESDRALFRVPLQGARQRIPAPEDAWLARGVIGTDGALWTVDFNPGAVRRYDLGAPAAVQRRPAIQGVAAEGESLACGGQQYAAWPGGARITGVQWLRDGAPVEGADQFTYAPGEADAGHALRCRVRARFDLQEVFTEATSDSVEISSRPDEEQPGEETPPGDGNGGGEQPGGPVGGEGQPPGDPGAAPPGGGTPVPGGGGAPQGGAASAPELSVKSAKKRLTVRRRKQAIALQLSGAAKLSFKVAPVKKGKAGKARSLGSRSIKKAGKASVTLDLRKLKRGEHRLTVQATAADGGRATLTLRLIVR